MATLQAQVMFPLNPPVVAGAHIHRSRSSLSFTSIRTKFPPVLTLRLVSRVKQAPPAPLVNGATALGPLLRAPRPTNETVVSPTLLLENFPLYARPITIPVARRAKASAGPLNLIPLTVPTKLDPVQLLLPPRLVRIIMVGLLLEKPPSPLA